MATGIPTSDHQPENYFTKSSKVSLLGNAVNVGTYDLSSLTFFQLGGKTMPSDLDTWTKRLPEQYYY